MKRKVILSLFLITVFTLFAQKQITNIPTFYINTKNNQSIVEKEVYLEGDLTIVSSDKSENYSGKIKIRGRGNSTWRMPKKPFKIKLKKKKKLLNQKAKAKTWVLLANYSDKSLIRNAVAFKASEILELDFTPSARFVDVVFNGEYLGNYMLSDQVQVKKSRVEIDEQEPTDTTEPNITGGYLLEIDGYADKEPVYFKTKKGMPITVKYPKDDEINTEQQNYIANYTQHFEDVLFSSNFKDPKKGYRAYVDTTSLINWYVACELTGNIDSFWSTYIYKKRNDPKFYFGPLWDFDLAFNNDYRFGDTTEKLMREDGQKYKTWIQRIWEDSWFQKAVNRRWKEVVNKGLEKQLIDYINSTYSLINESQKLNFEKWKILEKTVHQEMFNFSTYEENIDFLKFYIKRRIEFLNEGFVSEHLKKEKLLKLLYNPKRQSVLVLLEKPLYSSVKVYTLNGVEVMSVKSFSPNKELDVSRLSNQAYVVQLTIDNKIYSAKFIKW